MTSNEVHTKWYFATAHDTKAVFGPVKIILELFIWLEVFVLANIVQVETKLKPRNCIDSAKFCTDS